MQHDVKMYLHDILKAIQSIEEFIGEKRDFTVYDNNQMVKRAVEREFEIIGEATNRILKVDVNIGISEARRIVNLRNWVIHSYDNVDHILIWGIIHKDLPMLKDQVLKLLSE